VQVTAANIQTMITVAPLTFVAAILLTLQEGFHAVAHLNVLFRLKPPRVEELKRRGYYFLWDGISHLLPYFIHGRFLPYILIEFTAHMFYVITWNDNYYSVRIRDWSAREYQGSWITVDFFLTWSDIIGHCLNAYALSQIVGSWILIIWWTPYPLLLIAYRYYYNVKQAEKANNQDVSL
jgi:hypothetical protein